MSEKTTAFAKHEVNASIAIGRDRYQTEMRVNGHNLIADEPEEMGGTNEGPSPYGLLLASLGACTAMTIRMYADRKGWPLDGVRIDLRHRKIPASECEDCTSQTGYVDEILREVELLGDLDEAQRARLGEIANRCPVHRTLAEGEVRIREVQRAG